ncbi:ankyrin repeat domain-containing protein [Nocardioides sp.]|uniref:ankyrin repeat domain-containing protein n=1 Tax=Nocardioides sp. TaxID=35761 RepID=UPI001A2E316D|nr:ankyrin repeat domain-containing protein [Nocardioides sp.]MBJ7357770.1 ankyrin repeat domain-containing protein [Nocardioides sp.]
MSAGDWKDMFHAACAGDVELVRHHLATGVDPDFSHPEYQSTALVAAILAGQEDVARLLLDHGADPALRSDLDGLTPVQAARQTGLAGLEVVLRRRGAEDAPP